MAVVPSGPEPAIRKLAAGHWLTYSDGRVKIEPFWDVHFRRDGAIGEADAVEALRGALDLSVRQHLVSDLTFLPWTRAGASAALNAASVAGTPPGATPSRSPSP